MRTELFESMDSRTEMDPATAGGLTRLDRAINRAYRHVSMPTIREHPEMQDSLDHILITGIHEYSLVTGGLAVWAIYQVKLEDDEITLTGKRFRELNKLRRPDGRPSFYARWGNNLFINSNPTATENGDTLRVYFWRQPTALVAAAPNNVTLLTPVWDQVIMAGATYYGWKSLNVVERADMAREDFAALINEVPNVDFIEQRDDGFEIEPDLRLPHMEFGR
jgi:hypothetical protein